MFPPDAANLNLAKDTCLFYIQSASHTCSPEYVFDLVDDEVALAQARLSDKKGHQNLQRVRIHDPPVQGRRTTRVL